MDPKFPIKMKSRVKGGSIVHPNPLWIRPWYILLVTIVNLEQIARMRNLVRGYVGHVSSSSFLFEVVLFIVNCRKWSYKTRLAENNVLYGICDKHTSRKHTYVILTPLNPTFI